MLKSLRKYKQWILVFGGSLLMIAFLIPDAVHQLQGDPMDRVVGTLGGQKVRFRELNTSEREYQALKTLAPVLVRGIVDVQDAEQWMLLKREAEQAGLIGGPEDGRQWIPELARDLFRMEIINRYGDQAAMILNNPQILGPAMEQAQQELESRRVAAARQVQMTEPQIDQALANARGIMRLVDSYRRAARFSDGAVITGARELLDEATVDVLVIPASRAMTPGDASKPEQIQAQFDSFRSIRPGTGLNGFGYLQPPRIKLEWLTLDRKAMSEVVQLSPIDVRKRFEQNRATYKGEFAAERVQVEKDLRDEKVREMLSSADRVIQNEVRRATRKLEADGTYKKLPADWATLRPSLEVLAQAVVDGVKASSGQTIPLPTVTIKNAGWLTLDDVRKLPGVGTATIRFGSRSLELADVLLKAREITGPNEFAVQAGVPLIETTVIDQDENRYYVTVLEARPEEPPASLDEVKDKVAADVATSSAFGRLLNETAPQRALAAASGLDSVAQLYNAQDATAEPLKVRTGVSVSRQRPLPTELDAPEFRDAVVNAIAQLDPLKPAKEQDAVTRTLVVGMPGKLSVAIATITEVRPMTSESYRVGLENKVFQLQSREFGQALDKAGTREPFSYDALKTRLSYEPTRRNSSKDEDAEESPAQIPADKSPAATPPASAK
jgi:hypothetical protein